MKNLFAALVAVALMSCFAFASGYDAEAYVYGEIYTPGTTIYLEADDFDSDSKGPIPDDVAFTTEYFTVSSRSFSKGADLVKAIYIDDDEERLCIDLIDNYNKKVTSTAPNVVISKLTVKSIKDVKDGTERILSRNTSYSCTDKVAFIVGYESEDMDLISDGQEIYLADGESRMINWQTSDSYGTAQVYFGDEAYGETRVYKGDKSVFGYSSEVETNLYRRYPEADLRAINIKGNFTSKMNIEVYADRDEYVYIYSNGQLSASGLRWSEDTSSWVGSILKPTIFIVSDVRLAGISGGSNTGYENGYNNGYNQPSYSQPSYSQPSYSQPPYSQPSYQQPQQNTTPLTISLRIPSNARAGSKMIIYAKNVQVALLNIASGDAGQVKTVTINVPYGTTVADITAAITG